MIDPLSLDLCAPSRLRLGRTSSESSIGAIEICLDRIFEKTDRIMISINAIKTQPVDPDQSVWLARERSRCPTL